MTGEAINAEGLAFKQALIEASLNAEKHRDSAIVDHGRGHSTLVLEHRHEYTELSPAGGAFIVGQFGPPASD